MPSALALAVETVDLVTVFTGALGVSEPSSSLPGGQGRVSIGIGLKVEGLQSAVGARRIYRGGRRGSRGQEGLMSATFRHQGRLGKQQQQEAAGLQ